MSKTVTDRPASTTFRAPLEKLAEAEARLFAAQSPAEAIHAITEAARESLGAESVVLALCTREGDLQVQSISGVPNTRDDFRRARANGISVQVLESGEPRFMDDVSLCADASPTMKADGVRAAACLSLRLHAVRLGVLWVHYSDIHIFSEGERIALRIYADHAARAFDHAQRIHELQHLSDASDTFMRTQGESAALNKIGDVAHKLLEAQFVYIYPYDELSDTFSLNKTVEIGVPQSHKGRVPRATICRRVLDEGYRDEADLDKAIPQRLSDLSMEYLKSLGVRAYQGIRLEAEGERLGVLFADYTHPKHFSVAETEMLQRFVKFASPALRQARRYEQIQRAWKAVQAIAETSINGHLNEALRAIVKNGLIALRCNIVSVYAYDPVTRRVTDFDIEHLEPAPAEPQHPPDSVVDWVINQSEVQCIATHEGHPLLAGDFATRNRLKSCIAIKLMYENTCIGAVFFNYRRRHQFHPDEVEIIHDLAHQAATAIRTAQLRAQQALSQKHFDVLSEATLAMETDQPLESLGTQICALALREVNPADTVNAISHFALVDYKLQRLRFLSASHEAVLKELQHNERFGIDLSGGPDRPIGISGYAVKTGDIQNVGYLNQQKPSHYIHFRSSTRSQLSVPLMNQGKVLGVLSIEDENPAPFSEDDVKKVRQLAERLAVACALSSSYYFAEEAKREREATLRALLKINQVSMEDNLDRLLETTLHEAKIAFHFKIATLYAFRDSEDPRERRYIGVERLGYVGGKLSDMAELAEGSMRRHILNMDEPLYTDGELLTTRQALDNDIKSAIGFPLSFSNQRVGVLMLGYDVKRAWNKKEKEDLLRFTQLVSAAIYEFLLRQKFYQQVDAFRSLQKAAEHVAQHSSQSETVQRIVDHALKLFGDRMDLDQLSSHLALKKGESLDYFFSNPGLHVERMLIDLRQEPIGISGRVALTGTSVNEPYVLDNPDYYPHDPQTRSQLSVPIVAGTDRKVIGVLSLESPIPRAFTTTDLADLNLLAGLAAVGLENAMLHDQLEAIRDISQVGTRGSVPEIMEAIVSGARKNLGCLAAVLYPYDERFQTLLKPTPAGIDHDYLQTIGGQKITPESSAWQVLHTADAHVAVHGANLHQWIRPDCASAFDIATALMLPLRCLDSDNQERQVGLLLLGYAGKTPYLLSDSDIERAEGVARIAAISLLSARQHTQLNELERSRQAGLALAGFTLMTNTWLHELFGDISSVDQDIAAMWRYLAQPAVNTKEVLDSLARIGKVFSSIQDRAHLPPQPAHIEYRLVNLNHLLKEVVERCRKDAKYTHVQFEIGDSSLSVLENVLENELEIEADAYQLEQAFRIVIDNAAKAVKGFSLLSRRRILLSISGNDDNQVQITFRDFGNGFPDDILKQLQSGRRPSKSGARKGMGYGLIMASFIAELHGGKLEYQNCQQYGAAITFKLAKRHVELDASHQY